MVTNHTTEICHEIGRKDEIVVNLLKIRCLFYLFFLDTLASRNTAFMVISWFIAI